MNEIKEGEIIAMKAVHGKEHQEYGVHNQEDQIERGDVDKHYNLNRLFLTGNHTVMEQVLFEREVIVRCPK